MKRTYSQGWNEIFGKNLPAKRPLEQTSKPAVGASSLADSATTVSSADIDWKMTRALSIRQPWAELIMLGNKDVEYRSRATNVRGRVAIYASLSKESLPEAEDWGLDPSQLPRGLIIGTVELYDCDGGDWYLRDPKRLATPIKPTKRPQPIWFFPFGRE